MVPRAPAAAAEVSVTMVQWLRRSMVLALAGALVTFACSDATPRADCDGVVVDLGTNASHCGACGNACPSGTPCIDGLCQCTSGCVDERGACVDLTSDPMHCGACGTRCGEGETCQKGACQGQCDGIVCAGRCVSPSDPDNCGQCGRTCTAPETCQQGVCACPNDFSWAVCFGVCTDITSDPAHCGQCYNACPAGKTCSSSICQ